MPLTGMLFYVNQKCIHVNFFLVHMYGLCNFMSFYVSGLSVCCRRGTVTGLGKLMVEFPLHPGLTRAVLKAASLGCQDLLLPVAAMLSVENIFIRPGQYCSAFKTRNVWKSCLIRSRSWKKTLKYSHICGWHFSLQVILRSKRRQIKNTKH